MGASAGSEGAVGSDAIVFEDVRVFDGVGEGLSEPREVCVEGRKIVARVSATEPLRIAGGGRVLMPGLTDAHVHLFAAASSMQGLLFGGDGVGYYSALAEAGRMLMRGFTTVRDMAGDVSALRQVLDAGAFPGPRIYPSQAALSQTAGHGDFSGAHDDATVFCGRPSRAEGIGFMRVADGRDRVLAAVREQLKRGATQIKVMAGGGVTSYYDPLDVVQFTEDELRAAVEAAADWGTYVAAHVYNDTGIRRAVAAGIKSIEHGHLAGSRETVELLAEHDVWLSTQPFVESDDARYDPAALAKHKQVCEGVARTFEWARASGTKLAFGTDLLLDPQTAARQGEMFTRLSGHFGFTPVEALRMATSGNAELFRLSGERDPYKEARLGVIEPGAWADLLIVEGDPTRDLAMFATPETGLAVIVKDGRIYKNTLTGAS
ncbi:imidazolonepropionase-like amidohydrolase [Actinocorallia herbida]|uniref:Imidazolonepropionase-like amidohydrolase n=1 Tax=Actinocorallia herbida TaxID=58109 RepID=A0A3N1CZ95_9ACTN|nr:amidohydrolase family protein [Actinocorallia herbida]ROO86614.1 imidazolonepropionase-like amidohydrolase [Actinocorallia herbida]